MSDLYFEKYLKYKSKYNILKKQLGGMNTYSRVESHNNTIYCLHTLSPGENISINYVYYSDKFRYTLTKIVFKAKAKELLSINKFLKNNNVFLQFYDTGTDPTKYQFIFKYYIDKNKSFKELNYSITKGDIEIIEVSHDEFNGLKNTLPNNLFINSISTTQLPSTLTSTPPEPSQPLQPSQPSHPSPRLAQEQQNQSNNVPRGQGRIRGQFLSTTHK